MRICSSKYTILYKQYFKKLFLLINIYSASIPLSLIEIQNNFFLFMVKVFEIHFH